VSSALAFLDGAIARHGRPLGPDRVLIPRSQADLAAEAGRSAGTVAYYVGQLGGVVSREPNGLVVDVAALSAARQRARTPHSPRNDDVARELAAAFGDESEVPARLRDVDGRPPTLRSMATALGLSPSTTQRHLGHLLSSGRLQREGRWLLLWPLGAPPPQTATSTALEPAQVTALLAESLVRVAQELQQLAGHLVAGDGSTVPDGPRTARAHLALVPAGFRGVASRGSCFGVEEEERKLSPYLEDRDLRAEVRGPGLRDGTTQRSVQLSDRPTIEHAIQPLVALCERLRLPVALNAEGRRWLGLYSAEELRRGAEEISRHLQGPGPAITRPLGLLVAKAKRGEEEFFSPPPSPAPPPPRPVLDEAGTPAADEEAVTAVAAMTADELAALDEQICASGVLKGRFLRTAQGDPAVWDMYRQRAWRRRVEAGQESDRHGTPREDGTPSSKEEGS
jgi:AraC-like DNA-binding protein